MGIGISVPERVLNECKEVFDENKATLTKKYLQSEEEAVLIVSYTYEDENSRDMSPYNNINRKLWNNNVQDQIDNAKSYLQLLLRALRKLPRTRPQTLYRGIKNDQHKYVVGGEIEWMGFSSTTTSLKETQAFLTDMTTNKLDGTLFEIRNTWGYSISDFSAFPNEQGKKYKSVI